MEANTKQMIDIKLLVTFQMKYWENKYSHVFKLSKMFYSRHLRIVQLYRIYILNSPQSIIIKMYTIKKSEWETTEKRDKWDPWVLDIRIMISYNNLSMHKMIENTNGIRSHRKKRKIWENSKLDFNN